LFSQVAAPRLSETQLVQLMHDLASSIALAIQAGKQAAAVGNTAGVLSNKAAIAGLWVQFQAAAQSYQAIGATDRAVLDLVNTVGDNVQAALGAIPAASGKILGAVLGPLLVPVALAAGAVVLYILWRQGLLPKGRG
jgi:hypothetical protein